MAESVSAEVAAFTQSAIEDGRLPEYEVQPRAFKRLMLLSVAALTIFIFTMEGSNFIHWLDGATSQDHVASTIFFLNSIYFILYWLVYFSSGWGEKLKCQTLRTLLKSHSRLWQADEDANQITYYRDKARSTMTSQAIFIAITVFIINALSRDALITTPAIAAPLDAFIAYSALAAAAAAFTLLLISTDAADTMYNTFKVREYAAVSSLYAISARLKYYGFVLCFVSISLFSYTMQAYVASMTVVLLTLCGYPYWFKDISKHNIYKYEKRVYRLFVLASNGLVFSLAI